MTVCSLGWYSILIRTAEKLHSDLLICPHHSVGFLIQPDCSNARLGHHLPLPEVDSPPLGRRPL